MGSKQMSVEQYKTNYSTLTVEKCFGNHYVVPEFQREYVWEEENIEQLLRDLISAYYESNKKPYFVGMIVVYNGEDTALELVDGQQRITTFFILLCAIAHIYKENNDDSGKVFADMIHHMCLDDSGNAKDAYVLELQYASSSGCLNDIFHQDIPNESKLKDYSQSEQRLFNAYQEIKKELTREFNDFSEFKKFAVYISKKVEFVQIETPEVSDALKIFETINERGIGLNPMDLLKNMIFMNVPKDQFVELNKEWRKLIESLEKISEKPLRFLRYFISATYDISDQTGTIKGILPEDKTYKWLTENYQQCNYRKDPFGFVEALNEGVQRYTDFLQPNKVSVGNDYLRNVPRISGISYRLHLVLLLAAKNMDEDTLAHFKQVIESILYYATVCLVKANEIEKIFAAWCPLIRNVKNKEELLGFVGSSVIPQVNKWKQSYHQRFLLLNLNSIQQYRIRYIISRIAKYVDDVRGGGSQYADIDSYYDKKNQIEHIMPQTCANANDYDMTDEEFENYVGALGNLSLLEKTYNASCQNKPYEEKCKVYLSSAFYLTKSLPQLESVGQNTAANKMNEKMRSWSIWNKSAIDERQEMLYRISEMIWSIESYIEKW